MTDEPPQNNVIPLPTRKRYESFHESEAEVPRLALQTADMLVSVPYSSIGVIVFRFLTEDELSFTTPNHEVKIRGRKLRPLVDAMRRHACVCVQAFDARLFLPPTPGKGSESFVESIEIRAVSTL